MRLGRLELSATEPRWYSSIGKPLAFDEANPVTSRIPRRKRTKSTQWLPAFASAPPLFSGELSQARLRPGQNYRQAERACNDTSNRFSLSSLLIRA
jgi:hypothetical protein